MPNWVYNTLEIVGKPKALNKLLKQVEVTEREASQYNEPSKFSFHKVIPMPIDKKDNWYEWRISNWGTKWNAHIEFENFDEWESGRVYFDFNTAWSPAEPIVLEVSRQHPTLSFFWRYHEESHAFWGNHEIKNGKYLSQCEGEFNSCVEYNDFGLTHHECLTCENWVDECNNSNEREIEMCESCQHEKEKTEKEIAELEQELWG